MILSYRKYFKLILKDADNELVSVSNLFTQIAITLTQFIVLLTCLITNKVMFLYLLLSFIISKIVFGLINVFLFKDLFVLNDNIKNKSISPIIGGDSFFIGYLLDLVIGSFIKLITKFYNTLQNLIFKKKEEKVELDPETYRT